MDIPIELLIDYMGYLNPDVRLRARGGWIKGIKLLPETGRLDQRYLYVAANGPREELERGVPLVVVCHRDEPFDETLDNCILTPHAGAATKEASSNMSLMAAQNAIDILTTGECRFEV